MRNDFNNFLKDIKFHLCFLLFLNGICLLLFNIIEFPPDKSISPAMA